MPSNGHRFVPAPSAPVRRALPAELRGITYDDISSTCGATPWQLETERRLSRPTVRVVFDRVAPRCYAGAVRQLDRYGYTMGELIDSSAMKRYSIAQVRSRVAAYLRALGGSVDLWEIGNEVNGEWLSAVRCPGDEECAAQAHDVIAKVTAMYAAVHAAGYRTALTLYYQPPKTATRGYEMLTWERAYVPAALHAGLDYVFVSYYETDNGGIRPVPSQWQHLFSQLSADFPQAKVGFGEIGMDKPIVSATLAQASGIFDYYQTLALAGVPSYTRAGFWWNAAEDLVPATKWPAFFGDVEQKL
jgi:hypothetical protein